MMTQSSYLRRKGLITTSEHHVRIVEVALSMCLISGCDMRPSSKQEMWPAQKLFFFNVEMPGILHSDRTPLSQGAERSSCVALYVAGRRWSDTGFPNSAEAEVAKAVPNTNLYLVVL